MDEALGQSAAVSPPCLIASIQEKKPGPSTAREVDEGRGEDEETVRDRSKERAGHRGEKRRREREDPILQLLKEDIKYQREADERREAEARERSNHFFFFFAVVEVGGKIKSIKLNWFCLCPLII